MTYSMFLYLLSLATSMLTNSQTTTLEHVRTIAEILCVFHSHSVLFHFSTHHMCHTTLVKGLFYFSQNLVSNFLILENFFMKESYSKVCTYVRRCICFLSKYVCL